MNRQQDTIENHANEELGDENRCPNTLESRSPLKEVKNLNCSSLKVIDESHSPQKSVNAKRSPMKVSNPRNSPVKLFKTKQSPVKSFSATHSPATHSPGRRLSVGGFSRFLPLEGAMARFSGRKTCRQVIETDIGQDGTHNTPRKQRKRPIDAEDNAANTNGLGESKPLLPHLIEKLNFKIKNPLQSDFCSRFEASFPSGSCSLSPVKPVKLKGKAKVSYIWNIKENVKKDQSIILTLQQKLTACLELRDEFLPKLREADELLELCFLELEKMETAVSRESAISLQLLESTDQLKQMEQEIASLAQSNADLINTAAVNSAEMVDQNEQALTLLRASCARECSDLRLQLESSVSELSALQLAKSKADDKCLGLKDEMAIINTTAIALEASNQKLRADIVRMAAELDRHKDLLCQKDGDVRSALQSLGDSHAQLAEERAHTRSESQQTQARLRAVEEERSDLILQLTAAKELIASSAGQVASLKKSLLDAENKRYTQDAELLELKDVALQLAVEKELRTRCEVREEAERRERVAACAQLLATQMECDSRMREFERKAAVQAEALRADAAAEQVKTETAKAEASTNAEQILRLQTELEKLVAQAELLRQDCEWSKAEAHSQISDLQKQLQASEDDKSALTSALSTSKEQCSASWSQIVSLRDSQLLTLEEEKSALASELRRATEEWSCAANQVAALRPALACVEEKLAASEAELLHLKGVALQLEHEKQLRAGSEAREEAERRERVAASAQALAAHTEFETRIREYEQKLSLLAEQHRVETEALKSEAAAAKSEADESSMQMQSRLQALEEDRSVLTEALTQAKAECTTNAALIISLKQTLASQESKLSATETELQQLNGVALQLAYEKQLRSRCESREEDERRDRVAASAQALAVQMDCETRIREYELKLSTQEGQLRREMQAAQAEAAEAKAEAQEQADLVMRLEIECQLVREVLDKSAATALGVGALGSGSVGAIEELGRVSGELDALLKRMKSTRSFVSHCTGWDPEGRRKGGQFVDPYVAKMEAYKQAKAEREAAMAAAESPVAEVSAASMWVESPVSGAYTFDDLASSVLPPGVDPSRKEEYLDSPTFKAKFGMEKALFSPQPKWKRDAKKKQLGLF